jgi:hypothetical protein
MEAVVVPLATQFARGTKTCEHLAKAGGATEGSAKATT